MKIKIIKNVKMLDGEILDKDSIHLAIPIKINVQGQTVFKVEYRGVPVTVLPHECIVIDNGKKRGRFSKRSVL